MNGILQQIIVKTKKDLRERKKRVSLGELKGQIEVESGKELFCQAITGSVNKPAIIGEVKFASPTFRFLPSSSPSPLKGEGIYKVLLERVKQYESVGADAVSIITEPHFFNGSIDFVGKVKEAVELPVLQKDFVIDEYQIYEAKMIGSDALLLIARLVDKRTLREFVDLCFAEGIEPVVEVFSEEDLEKAVSTKTRFIAVNARDLDTSEVDVELGCRILRKIPQKISPNPSLVKRGNMSTILLGFSGIHSIDEVRKYREAGARGVLIGTGLMETKNIKEFLEGITINGEELDQI